MNYVHAVDKYGRQLKLKPLECVLTDVVVGEDFSSELKEIPLAILVEGGRYDLPSGYYHHKIGMMIQVEDEFDA